MTLNARSEAALEGVHPDLVAIVRRAAEKHPLIVTEGRRTLARQLQLISEGKSKLDRKSAHKGRHITGHAVDLVDTAGSYLLAEMLAIAAAMKAAAAELGLPLEWGGDWQTFKDTPHFQLPVALYPEVDWQADAKRTPGADADGRRAGPVVDAVATPTGWGGLKAALARSRTILGAQLAGLGGLIGYFDEAVTVLLEGIGEVTRLGPLLAALDLRAAGLGLTIFGVVLVVMRRLQAAYGGKQG